MDENEKEEESPERQQKPKVKKALNKEGEEGAADLKTVRPKKKAPAAVAGEEGQEEGGAKSARSKSKLKAPAEEGEKKKKVKDDAKANQSGDDTKKNKP